MWITIEDAVILVELVAVVMFKLEQIAVVNLQFHRVVSQCKEKEVHPR